MFIEIIEKFRRFLKHCEPNFAYHLKNKTIFNPRSNPNSKNNTSTWIIPFTHNGSNHSIYLKSLKYRMNYIWVNTENKNTHKSSILRMWKKWNTRRHERQSKMRRVHFDDSLVNAIEQTTKYIKCGKLTDMETLRMSMRWTHAISRSGTKPYGPNGNRMCTPCVCVFVSQVNLFDLILWVCSGRGIGVVDVVYFVVFIASNNDLIWCLAATMHTINVYKSFI